MNTRLARPGSGKYHIIAATGSAACGAWAGEGATPARTVPGEDRCQHPACRRWWPANLRAVS